jgi:hypothetical protein
MLSVLVLLLMMAAIFWPAYQVTRPALATPHQAPKRAPGQAPKQARQTTTPAPEEPALRVGRLEDYVQQGLVDLRIMLVQAARRWD